MASNPIWPTVAHLYLGCKVEVIYPKMTWLGIIKAVSFDGCKVYSPVANTLVYKDSRDIKPYLRRLESLTEDELKAWANMRYPRLNQQCLEVHWYSVRDCEYWYVTDGSNDGPNCDYELSEYCLHEEDAGPQVVAYLLTLHIDLFGLIDAGEALDLATLNNPTDGN